MAKAAADPLGLSRAQQLQMVQYGGAVPGQSRGFMSSLLNGLGYVGDFVGAVNATPQGTPGLFGGLSAVNRRYNVQKYNQYQAKQQVDTQAEQGRIARQLAPNLFPDVTQGAYYDPTDLQKTLEMAGQAQGNAAAGQVLQGETPTIGPLVPTAQTSDLVGRAQGLQQSTSASNERNAMLSRLGIQFQIPSDLPVAQQDTMFKNLVDRAYQSLDSEASRANFMSLFGIGAGATAGVYGGKAAPAGQSVAPAKVSGPAQAPIIDNGQPATLQGGVGVQAAPGFDPTLGGVVDPAFMTATTGQGRQAYTDGQTYGQNERQLNEAKTHNRATEGIGWKNAESSRISALKPPGGGNQNPYAALNGQQNYLQGQATTLTNKLKLMGFMQKDGSLDPRPEIPQKTWFYTPKPSDISKAKQAQALYDQLDQLQSAIGGVPVSPQAQVTPQVAAPVKRTKAADDFLARLRGGK